MARIRLRFVQGFIAHGRAYYYFRKPGCARVKLPGLPGSEQFMAAYQAALVADAPPTDIGAKRNATGSVAALVAAYAASSTFRDLAAETQRNRWVILRRFGDEHGNKRVALLKREHVEALLRGKRPFPRQNFLKALRPLLQFAVSIGWCKDDPTRELRATAKRGPASGRGARSRSRPSVPFIRSARAPAWRSSCCSAARNAAATSCAWGHSTCATASCM
jgi:hypothetical protein